VRAFSAVFECDPTEPSEAAARAASS
jgi:hypothetical protein